MEQTRKIITIGVFDMCHEAHRYFLKRASRMGDEFYVFLTTDQWARRKKGPGRPVNKYKQRKHMIQSLGYKVCQWSSNNIRKVLSSGECILVLGYDQQGSWIKRVGSLLGGESNIIRLSPGRIVVHTTEILNQGLSQ